MKRVFNQDEPELMDRPQPVTPELEADLVNLESLNRHFGSHRLVRKFVENWWQPGRNYRVLDLATGAGDIPRVLVDFARSKDIALRVDALDANESTLEIARRRSADYPEIHFIHGDVLRYEAVQSYDLVCCSLAAHHFSDSDAVRLLLNCRKLSHRWVLVSDLERSGWTTFGVYALTALVYRDPMTKSDARVSAKRAFSFMEFRALAESAGWQDYGHARFLFCRQALWLQGREFGEIPVGAVSVADAVVPCPAA